MTTFNPDGTSPDVGEDLVEDFSIFIRNEQDPSQVVFAYRVTAGIMLDDEVLWGLSFL